MRYKAFDRELTVRDVRFSEVQKFRQAWLWLLMLGILAVTVSSFAGLFIGVLGGGAGAPERAMPASGLVLGFFFSLFVIAAVSILLWVIRLETQITGKGICYRFFPFHLRTRMIEWKDVERCYVRRYRPVLEYGGWGIRFGLGGRGRAYNVSGNVGLQLELKGGGRVLIGTRRPDEMDRAIERIVQR